MTCRSIARSRLFIMMMCSRWDVLGLEIRTYLLLTRDNSEIRQIENEHIPVLEALEAGDGRKAGLLLRSHASGRGGDNVIRCLAG